MVRGTTDLLFAAAAFATVAIVAGPASAQVKPGFERAYTAAQDAYNLGSYDKARALFEAARKEQDLPGPYRWLAQVAKVQGRFEDCLTEAAAYLAKVPEGKLVPDVRALHAACRAELGRPAAPPDLGDSGALAVTSNVEGATITLNGLKYGATPMLPRAVTAGRVQVGISARRYLAREVEVDVVAGIVTDVRIDLEVDPEAPPEASLGDPVREVKVGWLVFAVSTPHATVTIDGKAAAPDERGRLEHTPGLHEVVIRAPGYEAWRRRVRVVRGQQRTLAVTLRDQQALSRYRRWGYVSLGTAAVATLAGVVLSFREQDARERAQDIWDVETRRPVPPLDDLSDQVPVRTRADLNDAVDDARAWRTWSTVAFGVAAVATGASIYLFVKERPVERAGFALPLAVTPVPDERGGVAGVAATYTTKVDW